MNHSLFRRILDLILGRVARRLDDVTKVARSGRGGPPEGLDGAVLEVVQEGRAQAWAATAAYLRAQARALGADEAYIPEPRPYRVQAIRAAEKRFSDPYGRDWGQMRADMQRHVITASRQAVVDAVEDAEDAAEILDDLEGLEDNMSGFPEEQRAEAIEEIREHAKKADKASRRSGVKGLFDEIMERLDEAADELAAAELGEQAKRAEDEVAKEARDEVYRKDAEGRTIARPFAWARVVRPSENGPCGFCAMLASRGPVYKSSKSAGVGVTRFHSGCRCEVVGVYTSRSWPGKEDSQEYARLYNEVVRKGGLHGAEARTGMDNAVRGNRSSDKSAARNRRKESL